MQRLRRWLERLTREAERPPAYPHTDARALSEALLRARCDAEPG